LHGRVGQRGETNRRSGEIVLLVISLVALSGGVHQHHHRCGSNKRCIVQVAKAACKRDPQDRHHCRIVWRAQHPDPPPAKDPPPPQQGLTPDSTQTGFDACVARLESTSGLYLDNGAGDYGLYQFTGIKGKKALVVVTDGKDTASKFDYDTLVEYVKKSGIAIYGIGLKISGTDLEVKYKLNHISQATGGQTFYIDSAKNLEAVYRQINEDLRSQYLLTYYSSNTEAKDQWRKVEVKVEPTNLSARTISGYYP